MISSRFFWAVGVLVVLGAAGHNRMAVQSILRQPTSKPGELSPAVGSLHSECAAIVDPVPVPGPGSRETGVLLLHDVVARDPEMIT